jgi:hypothetical protein
MRNYATNRTVHIGHFYPICNHTSASVPCQFGRSMWLNASDGLRIEAQHIYHSKTRKLLCGSQNRTWRFSIGNWIADPIYLKEQPPVIVGCRDDQLSMSETGPNWVNWSDPLNGGCWYNFDLRAGGRQFNLAEMPPPEIYCLNHHSTSYKHH